MADLRYETAIGMPLGMNDSATPATYKQGEVAYALNVRIAPDGAGEVLLGSQRTHAAALNSGAQCYGATGFRTTAGVNQICAVFGDKFYYSIDDGLTWTNAAGATGLTQDYWSFATIADGTGTVFLCCTNPGGYYTWDGATWTNVAGAPSGGLYVVTYNSRSWVSDGRSLYASAVRDPTTWTAPPGIVVPVQTHDGDSVTGLGVVGGFLFVFKRNSTALVSGYGNADVSVQTGPVGVSRSVGLIGFRTFCPIGDSDAAWLSEQGVAVYQNGRIKVVTNDKLRAFWRSVSVDTLAASPGIPTAMYEAARHEYTVSLPVGLMRNNYDIIVNTTTMGPTLGTRTGSTGLLLSVDANGVLVAGTTGQHPRILNGVLTLAEPDQSGPYVEIGSDGELVVAGVDYDPAALFVADTAIAADATFAAGYDGFLRRLEAADDDDVLVDGTGGTAVQALVIDRPRFVAALFEPKRVRKVEALVASPTASTVTLDVRGDGTEGTQHAIAVAAAVASQPRWVHAHVNVRGRTVQAVFRSSAARMRIAGFRLWAEILRRAG